ncbi:hypothetical protein K438DRAFT_1797083 [Mycena galopus ATCC 62051]|nr:hypothetical protein K438DRAFT_1797083 [Mycena galopus ATCC 62051]
MAAICNDSGCIHSRTCPASRLATNRADPINDSSVQTPKRASRHSEDRVPCIFFSQNRCSEGDRCRFSHTDVRPNISSPCKFFRQGLCRNGGSCLFFHDTSPPTSSAGPNGYNELHQGTSDAPSEPLLASGWDDSPSAKATETVAISSCEPSPEPASASSLQVPPEPLLTSGWDDPPSVKATENVAISSENREPSTEREAPLEGSSPNIPPSEPASMPSPQVPSDPLLTSGCDDPPSMKATENVAISSESRESSTESQALPQASSSNIPLFAPGAAAFEPCTFHTTGQCVRGDSCVVDHALHAEQLYSPILSRTSPLTGGWNGSDGDWVPLSQTAIARATNYTSPLSISTFPPGVCNMGFMHGYEHHTWESPTIPQNMKHCKHFALGTCRKGNDCPMVHDIRAQPEPDRNTGNAHKKGFCRDYSAGRCRRGDSCRFRHDSDTWSSPRSPTRVDPEQQDSGWLAHTDDWGADPQAVSNWAIPAPVSQLQDKDPWGESAESNWTVPDSGSEPQKDSLSAPDPVISHSELSGEQGTSWLDDTDGSAADPQNAPEISESQEDNSVPDVDDRAVPLDWFQEVEESRAIQDLQAKPAPPAVSYVPNPAADDWQEEKSQSNRDPVDSIPWDGPQEDNETKWGLPNSVTKPQSADSSRRGVSTTKSGWLQEIDDNEWTMEQHIEENSKSTRAQQDSQKNTMLCVYFQQDRCSRGDNCRFAHTLVPCSFFRQGLCRNGNSCRFFHDTSVDHPSSFSAGNNAGDDLERFSETPAPSQTDGLEVQHSEENWLHQTDQWNEWNAETTPDDWLEDAPPKTSSHHEGNGWVNAVRPSAVNLEEEQAWGQQPSDARPSEPEPTLLPEPERELPPQLIYRCTVRFGAGANAEEVVTQFDSRRLVLSDYPLGMTHDDLVQLAKPYGVVTDAIFSMTRGGIRANLEFAEHAQAAKARVNLNGVTFGEVIMHAQLDSVGSVGGNVHEPATGRQLKLSWDSPSSTAWVFYPTVGVAKAESARLDGIVYGKRKITAAYAKPRQTHSIPVLLELLPPNVKSEDLHKFCVGSSSVSLNPPNYRGSQNDNILAYLKHFGPVNFFEVLPTDPSHLEITGFVEFATGEAAANALQALRKTKHHDFLGKGSISAQSVVYSKNDCSNCPFSLIRDDLERLSGSSAHPECTIRCYDQPPRVHIYGSQAQAVAQLRKCVQDLLFGFELASWDPYFDLPSCDEALKRINEDPAFHVRRDKQRRALRIWGSRQEAEKKITRLLKNVRTKRHCLRLDKGSMSALIKGGLQSLQDAFGASKILLDVRSQTMTVLGDIKTDVESRLKDLAVRSSPGTGNCCLCFSDAVEPVQLACSHTYCSDCFKLLLRPVPGLEFIIPTCVAQNEGGPCLVPVPIGAISSHLSDTDQTKLFESSLLSLVRSEPNFRFCPSGCPVIYQLGMAGTVYTCPDCGLELCASCADPVHSGMTCAEYTILRDSGFRESGFESIQI